MLRSVSTTFVIAALVAAVASLDAQAERPRAELTAVTPSAPVRAGKTVRLSLQVKLPKDIHVQANTPRDPSLIPTVLTVDAPAGVKVEKISYPAPIELAQTGRSDKLQVLGPEFVIEVELAIAASASAGDRVVPARLRYQSCNDAVCYPPATAVTEWTLHVQAPG